MSYRISPILSKESKTLDWKINKKKTCLENLEDLFSKVLKEVKAIKAQKISPLKEREKRKNLQEALSELGTNLESIMALHAVCGSQNTIKLSKILKKKESPELNREYLFLVKNVENVRKNSTNYEEAWREIEAEYFLKISLYNAEILRRLKT
jgi:hypothetical protein